MASPGCGGGGTGGWSCGGIGAAVEPSGVPHFTQNRVPGSFEAPQLVQNIGTQILRSSEITSLLYLKRRAFATELVCFELVCFRRHKGSSDKPKFWAYYEKYPIHFKFPLSKTKGSASADMENKEASIPEKKPLRCLFCGLIISAVDLKSFSDSGRCLACEAAGKGAIGARAGG